MRRYNEMIYLIIFVALLWYVAVNPAQIGLPAGIGEDLIGLTPGLIVCFLSLKAYSQTGSSGRSVAFIGIGLGLAVFIGAAYNLGLVSANMLDGLTIAQVQTWVVVFSGLLAGVDYYRSI